MESLVKNKPAGRSATEEKKNKKEEEASLKIWLQCFCCKLMQFLFFFNLLMLLSFSAQRGELRSLFLCDLVVR